MKNKNRLLRYTNLPVLLDMLINKKITLLDPSSWEDRNDAFYVEKYKEIKNLKTVLALCFTTKAETFHHWKVFADSSAGVCVRFNKYKFFASLKKDPGIKIGNVTYNPMRTLESNPPTVDELPFIKRKQYEDEKEVRIIYVNRSKIHQVKDIAIDLQSIERITLSPWMPDPISNAVKKVIQDIDGCDSIQILKTGVVEYRNWKKSMSSFAKH